MSGPDTNVMRATYATAATYRQSPSPERAVKFDRWLDQVKAAARREGLAQGWAECATESGDRGWMHDYAVTEMQDRNPYRQETDRG